MVRGEINVSSVLNGVYSSICSGKNIIKDSQEGFIIASTREISFKAYLLEIVMGEIALNGTFL